MRRLFTFVAAAAVLLITAGPALACGGLIGPNGAVNLLRTTTFAGYHDGVEHYVTAFQFAGGGGAFGSIVPLPDVPTSVERGGDWTLQRLVRETDPPTFRLEAAAAAGDAEVLLQTRIDALDITILRGGGAEIGKWATEHGFRLPPDAPEVLDFYANRSPIFMAASFDADAARERGQQIGDGTPVHLTIPTDEPWVPLRILGLGKVAGETVQADVYLLTDAAESPPRALRKRPEARPQCRGDRLAPGRPALRQGNGLDPGQRLAEQGPDRCRCRSAQVRPRHRPDRDRHAVADRYRPGRDTPRAAPARRRPDRAVAYGGDRDRDPDRDRNGARAST